MPFHSCKNSSSAHGIALVACAVAMFLTSLATLQSPPRFRAFIDSKSLSRIDSLERRFRECYRKWRPEHGVRSPCPEIQNETNMQLLELLGLRFAPAENLTHVLGRPEAVYRNGENPNVFHWCFRRYWATTGTVCVMLLPRCRNYDAMMKLALSRDGSLRVSLAEALRASAHTNRPLDPEPLEAGGIFD